MTNASITAAAIKTAHPASSLKWHALLAASLGILFDAMDASIYFMVLHPALGELLKTSSDAEIGWYGSIILALFMVGWSAGSFLFGVVADYIGRARTMVITILLYAVCTGLCATANSWAELGFYRFLVGVGIGGEISIGAVMLSECWPGRGRIFATCAMEMSFCVGYLITSLANLGLGHMSWRLMFVVGIVPAFLTLFIRAKLKEPASFLKVKNARAKLKFMGESAVDDGDRRLTRHSAMEIFAPDVRSNTAVVTILAGVAIVGYWAALSWIPAWVNQITGTLAVEERSTVGIVMNVGGIISCLLAGLMVLRWGRANTLKLSFGGALFSTAAMFLFLKTYSALLLFAVFWVGFFSSMPFVVLCILIPEMFATRMLGSASGFAFSVGRLVAAGAAIGGGAIIQAFDGSYAAAGATAALIYAAGYVAACFVPRTSGEVAGVDTQLEMAS